MIDTATIADVVAKAAAAASGTIPIADEMKIGKPITTTAGLMFEGVAVTARFTGSPGGEVLVAVEQAVADALLNSPLGALDVTAALAPSLTAAAESVGTVVLGPGQALEPVPAVDSLLEKPNAAIVPLSHGGKIRALVGIVLNEVADEGGNAAPSAPNYPTRDELRANRAAAPAAINRHGLEMLRDVAMDVTAQIGSTRMTVSELLSLSDGAVIELDRAAGAPADLLVNGHLIARGEVVVIDENFGLRITEIISGDDALSA
ncbi:flagellar motor switch protein FliN [Jatrophihabitans telluris]|uniref:Flagellar motor switch protein FliN n=1 Tax=Jatrophihabitans telluris TaxID=2038343 RepID=A0ABY4QWG5_9ACTN|nr:flagellar motor switch protein FliN [Jatrophihabitans telluris]UQX87964.1 flagellar motor switch protein FliN [Jatrophihabitans telluris]